MSPPTATLYPNGQQLISSALTVPAINAFMLAFTCGMLGINPPDYSQVRDEWPVQGQPFEDVGTDVCYVSCVPENVDYRLVRNKSYTAVTVVPGQPEQVQENWTYTRGWRISWHLYGPSATDRARQIHSAMFLDIFNDQLNGANLFPVPDMAEPTRLPELINAQWFEHSYFDAVMYENITETILDGAATSVEVRLYDASPGDPVADFTVPNPSS